MAVRLPLLAAVLAAALAMAGCGSSEEAAPAPASSTVGATVPGAKAPSDAATAADASKGERDGSDMPGGGPGKP